MNAENPSPGQPLQIFVRYLPGVVGESRRVVHVVPIADVNEIPEVLVAHCGERIRPGVAEQLYAPIGAPCNVCLFAASTPSGIEVPAHPTSHEVTTVSDSQAPTAPPLTPAIEALLRRGRTTADRMLIAHVSRDGHCPIRCCVAPCPPAQLADHNLELLA